MKKIFCILAAVIAAASLTVSAYAEEIAIETATEAAETAVETETETVAEMDTEASLGISDELAELLGASTPEKVEHVKEYLLYGLATLPFSERVKLAVVAHIDVMAWGLVGIAVVVAGILYLRSNKKTTDTNQTLTNNATELYEQGVERSEAAAKTVEESEQRIKKITDEAMVTLEALTKNSDEILRTTAAEMLRKVVELAAENKEVMAKVAERDKGLAEGIMMLNGIVANLINLSDIPEAERDAVMAEYYAAKKRIKGVMADDEEKD